ncbi:MAG TPA: DNA-processing protein DprA [Terriglobales bacterium]|nr:DNA-processing protein DprA [Terriglobales bacterium]
MLTHAEELHSSLTGLVAEDNGLGAMLDGEQIRSLRANASKNFEVWQKVRDLGGRVLSYLDPDYPDSLRLQLGRQAPPLLFTRGNLSLLSRPSLGFCGSRKASEKGLAVAEECARMVSTDGINVISGYAAGVDMATHRAALQSGGTTAIVLPEGILHFRIKQDIKDIWDWQRVLVISQYPPGLTWSVRNAMLRNQTICGLCRVMVLIEARETGGSMEAGRTCLKLGIPLFAPVYDGMPEFARGNQILLHEGARSLYKSKSTNLPNLRNLMSAFEEPVEQ